MLNLPGTVPKQKCSIALATGTIRKIVFAIITFVVELAKDGTGTLAYLLSRMAFDKGAGFGGLNYLEKICSSFTLIECAPLPVERKEE